MYKYIIFDYDGTLVNSLCHWLAGYKKVLKQFGIKASKKKIIKHCFGQKNGVENLGIKKSELFYEHLLKEVFSNFTNYPSLFSGVSYTLKKLKDKNINLSIVSSSDSKTIKAYLQNKYIANLFDLIIGYDDVLDLKPNPEGIFKVIKFYDNNCLNNYLFVGDSIKDLLAAKNANIDFCLFSPKANSFVDDSNELLKNYTPKYHIENFTELLKFFN